MRWLAEFVDDDACPDDVDEDNEDDDGPVGLESIAWQFALGCPLGVTERGLLVAHGLSAGGMQLTPPLLAGVRLTVANGVAVLPVRGLLRRRDYDTVRAALDVALEDIGVRAILLDVNSHGGTLDGCGELAADIRRAGSRKRVAAYISNDGGASAYVLAAAAGRIDAAPTALVGGLGVCMVYVDYARAEAMAGVETIEIVSSQTPRKDARPTTPTGRGQWERVVSDLAAVMLDDVARYRPILARGPRVRWGDGQLHVGAEAVRRGLVDSLSTLDAVCARMAKG